MMPAGPVTAVSISTLAPNNPACSESQSTASPNAGSAGGPPIVTTTIAVLLSAEISVAAAAGDSEGDRIEMIESGTSGDLNIEVNSLIVELKSADPVSELKTTSAGIPSPAGNFSMRSFSAATDSAPEGKNSSCSLVVTSESAGAIDETAPINRNQPMIPRIAPFRVAELNNNLLVLIIYLRSTRRLHPVLLRHLKFSMRSVQN